MKLLLSLALCACSLYAAKPSSGATINMTSLASGIIYCAPMNEGSGTTVTDLTASASSGAFGTSGSAPSWVNDSATYQPGVSFSGGQHVTITNNTGLGSMSAFSMMVIGKPTSTASYPMFFSTGSAAEVELRLENTSADINYLLHSINNFTSGQTYTGSPHVFIITFSSTAGHGTNVYVDGSNVITHTSNTTSPVINQASWFIGARDAANSFPFTGTIYTLVMWNRELSSSDVTSLQSDPWSYLTGSGGSTPIMMPSIR